MKRIRLAVVLGIWGILLGQPLFAATSWNQWLYGVKQDAISEGIPPAYFDQIFKNVTPNQRVNHFARTQPERRLTFLKYRNSRIKRYRIILGRRKYKQHKRLLTKIGQEYGVDSCYITAIWGLETSYGNFMGSFPVIRSLATLAYDSRRKVYFRKELLYALHIVYEGHVHPDKFKGEWAGASGHPQFMPSSWHRYAKDYNGDNKKDIWGTYSDVFASIANYLKQKGWKTGEPIRLEVSLTHSIPKNLLTLKQTKLVSEWTQMGVRTKAGGRLPYQHLSASLIEPYGGPYFLVFNNFKVLMRYNNSTYYAGSLAYLADNICRRAER